MFTHHLTSPLGQMTTTTACEMLIVQIVRVRVAESGDELVDQ